MIKIQKAINKTLVPMNFIKGLEILYKFMVVAGMVSIVESQAIATYFFSNSNAAAGVGGGFGAASFFGGVVRNAAMDYQMGTPPYQYGVTGISVYDSEGNLIAGWADAAGWDTAVTAFYADVVDGVTATSVLQGLLDASLALLPFDWWLLVGVIVGL